MTARDEAAAEARHDWERRIYRRVTDAGGADAAWSLPPPPGLRADPGTGHIRLSWQPVPGAAGYLIERLGPADGQPQIISHGGSDVPAVPGPPFADTGLDDDTDYSYRVGAVTAAGHPACTWSEPVRVRTAPGSRRTAPGSRRTAPGSRRTAPGSRDGPAGPAAVRVEVDASTVTGRLDRVWRMVGSERLTQLRFGDDGHGHHIGAEFAEALSRARDDLGVTHVRAHAILHDDNAVVSRGPDGGLAFDFGGIDALYDRLITLGLRPVIELSFMPAAMARDPEQIVFGYRGIISPPADWAQWRALVTALARHLVGRYGIDEVAQWPFEVWNEPNLEVFWSGAPAEYLRLYDESARAVKSVDDRLKIGGPATAAAEWVEELAVHAASAGVPLDFVSTHTYGNLPLDVRPALTRHGLGGIPAWWTEWGIGATHFGPVHDSAAGAPFVLTGYQAVQGRLDALAYWVISDHFEELGRPPRLFHDGFGLLTVGNLRKPRYWAAHLAAHLGDDVLASQVTGDGAEALVRAWATRHADGRLDILLWNGTLNAALADGDPRLDRRVRLAVTGLPAVTHQAELARVDQLHSNIAAHCPPDVDWPDDALWARLRARDELHTERLPDLTPANGSACLDLDLPMPGVARIRLTAGGQGATGPAG
jgi:xylan 1,4-beta-xylosidase